MRLVKLLNGKEIEVKPLTGAQVRQLRAEKGEGFDETFSVAKMIGIPEKDIDAMPFPDLMAIHKGVIGETFGIDEEVKN